MVDFINVSDENKSSAPVCQACSAIQHFDMMSYPSLLSPTDSEDVRMVMSLFVENGLNQW